MKENTEIIKSLFGKRLTDGKIQSFHLNGKLANKINCTFLQFEDKWLRIVVDDEIATLHIVNQAPKKNGCKADFYYPITNIINCYPEFQKYLGKKLIECKELIEENHDYSYCYGVLLKFEENEDFIIFDHISIDQQEFIFNGRLDSVSLPYG